MIRSRTSAAVFVLCLAGTAAPAPADLMYVAVANNTIVTLDTSQSNPTPVSFAPLAAAGGVAFDASGNLYVSTVNGTIDKITPGGMPTLFATTGSDTAWLAFDASGNLYADRFVTPGVIDKVSPGGVVTVFATTGNTSGLAFDASGNLFASNGNAGTIDKITPAGTETTFVTGLGGVGSLAFDASGNLFAAVRGANFGLNSSIVEITPGGVESVFASGLNGSGSIAFDSSGNLYAPVAGNQIERFTPGGVGTIFAVASTGANIVGLAIAPSSATSVAPEPSTLVLGLAGLVMLAACRLIRRVIPRAA
jgi:sugar lactone lactonase YvrE